MLQPHPHRHLRLLLGILWPVPPGSPRRVALGCPTTADRLTRAGFALFIDELHVIKQPCKRLGLPLLRAYLADTPIAVEPVPQLGGVDLRRSASSSQAAPPAPRRRPESLGVGERPQGEVRLHRIQRAPAAQLGEQGFGVAPGGRQELIDRELLLLRRCPRSWTRSAHSSSTSTVGRPRRRRRARPARRAVLPPGQARLDQPHLREPLARGRSAAPAASRTRSSRRPTRRSARAGLPFTSFTSTLNDARRLVPASATGARRPSMSPALDPRSWSRARDHAAAPDLVEEVVGRDDLLAPVVLGVKVDRHVVLVPGLAGCPRTSSPSFSRRRSTWA